VPIISLESFLQISNLTCAYMFTKALLLNWTRAVRSQISRFSLALDLPAWRSAHTEKYMIASVIPKLNESTLLRENRYGSVE